LKPEYLLGIDVGSSACKVTFLNTGLNFSGNSDKDNKTTTRGKSQSVKPAGSLTLSREYKTFYPRAGWAEQDCRDWIAAATGLIEEGFFSLNTGPESIIAVCVSGVTHSPVLLDRNNEVLGNVMHITDSRSVLQSSSLQKYNRSFLKYSLNPVSPMWTISMLSWISKNEPEKWKKIKKIIFPKDYLRFLLIGNIATDYIDAEGTLLYDSFNKKWRDELAGLINLDKNLLPDICGPLDIAGKVTQQGSKLTGLKEGTPVITGTTDTLCEIFAAGNLLVGDCTIKLATFGRICVLADKPYTGEGLITYSYITPGMWYPGTGTKSFASSFRWLKEQFYREKRNSSHSSFEEIDMDADKINAGSDGLIFHPYLLGEGSPYNDPLLRGAFLGININHQREHFARSVLEGTCFSLRDSLEFINNKGIAINKEIKFIGGGSRSVLWTGILADILGIDGSVPSNTDASFGAAMLAGIPAGVYSSFEDACKKNSGILRKIKHNSEKTRLYNEVFTIYKKSAKKLKGINHDISALALY
jgi:xylulokinase